MAPETNVASIDRVHARFDKRFRKCPGHTLVDDETKFHLSECTNSFAIEKLRGVGHGCEHIFFEDAVLLSDFIRGDPGSDLSNENRNEDTSALDDGLAVTDGRIGGDAGREVDHDDVIVAVERFEGPQKAGPQRRDIPSESETRARMEDFWNAVRVAVRSR